MTTMTTMTTIQTTTVHRRVAGLEALAVHLMRAAAGTGPCLEHRSRHPVRVAWLWHYHNFVACKNKISMYSMINCGTGYVYNPDSGKCIKESGTTAKRLKKKYGSVSQYGTCDGEVFQSVTGIPYCSKSGTVMQKKRRQASSVVTGTSQIRVDDRIAEALREVKRTLVRKDARIRDLKRQVETQSTSSKSRTQSLEKQLQACEKRVDSLISKVAASKKTS